MKSKDRLPKLNKVLSLVALLVKYILMGSIIIVESQLAKIGLILLSSAKFLVKIPISDKLRIIW